MVMWVQACVNRVCPPPTAFSALMVSLGWLRQTTVPGLKSHSSEFLFFWGGRETNTNAEVQTWRRKIKLCPLHEAAIIFFPLHECLSLLIEGLGESMQFGI